jgi:hypothetical protein
MTLREVHWSLSYGHGMVREGSLVQALSRQEPSIAQCECKEALSAAHLKITAVLLVYDAERSTFVPISVSGKCTFC